MDFRKKDVLKILRANSSDAIVVISQSQQTLPRSNISRNKYSCFSDSPLTSLLRSNRKGLTLLELVVGIAIVGALGAIAIPQYQRYQDRATYLELITEMKMIESEIVVFEMENDRFPEDLSELSLSSTADPWGNPFQYLNIQTVKGTGKVRKDHNLVPVNTDFDLYSMGPDGKSQSPFTAKESRDDIVRANDGGYFGKVSEY